MISNIFQASFYTLTASNNQNPSIQDKTLEQKRKELLQYKSFFIDIQ